MELDLVWGREVFEFEKMCQNQNSRILRLEELGSNLHMDVKKLQFFEKNQNQYWRFSSEGRTPQHWFGLEL
jgi:hypothetical protein